MEVVVVMAVVAGAIGDDGVVVRVLLLLMTANALGEWSLGSGVGRWRGPDLLTRRILRAISPTSWTTRWTASLGSGCGA